MRRGRLPRRESGLALERSAFPDAFWDEQAVPYQQLG